MTTLAAAGSQRYAWLLLAFPLAGAVILLLGGKRTNSWGHLVGATMPVAAFAYGVVAFVTMLSYPAAQRSRDLHLFNWIDVGTFRVDIGLQLDQLSICFVLLITGVGSLIHIFAVGYMAQDPERRRFFGYMNLFLAAMLLLVLADNYLGLYAGLGGRRPGLLPADRVLVLQAHRGHRGQEGVHRQPRRRRRAVYRDHADVRDVRHDPVRRRVPRRAVGQLHHAVTALCLLLLLGACGKSAQLPLQSWLLDAMEGPTPVSALIHAATMVTAGVYLIVRSNPLFNLSADARLVVTIVGAVTLLFGAIIGCAKDDIKKALAGSTMSQIGYMMLAAGLGPAGYAFAIAHLLAHGFFKAGLFLGAGSVKHEMNDEVDMRRFGGLGKIMPITFVTFLIGYLAIIGVPPFSGFFTKDSDHRGGLRQGRHVRDHPGLRGRARRGDHRVLHDPGHVHDVRRGAPLGRERAPARGAAGDDRADDPARGGVGRGRRVPHPRQPARRLPGPGGRGATGVARDSSPCQERSPWSWWWWASGSPGRCTGGARYR